MTDIKNLVDETIHRSILEFDPDIPGSYQQWIEILKGIEKRVDNSMGDDASAYPLLARIRSQLALIASMANEHAEAERFAESVLAVAVPEDPNFSFAVLTRTRALHQVGRHEEEIAEALRHVEENTFPGQAILHLFSELARDHPGEIDWKEPLIARIREYVRERPDLSKSVQDSQLSESRPEEYIISVRSIDQMLNRERMARARARASEA